MSFKSNVNVGINEYTCKSDGAPVTGSMRGKRTESCVGLCIASILVESLECKRKETKGVDQGHRAPPLKTVLLCLM